MRVVFGSTDPRYANRLPRVRGEAPRPWAVLPLSLRDARTTNGSESRSDGPNKAQSQGNANSAFPGCAAKRRDPGLCYRCPFGTQELQTDRSREATALTKPRARQREHSERCRSPGEASGVTPGTRTGDIAGEPKTMRHTGVHRARNNPRLTSSRRFAPRISVSARAGYARRLRLDRPAIREPPSQGARRSAAHPAKCFRCPFGT
jgi:hypothetical protein